MNKDLLRSKLETLFRDGGARPVCFSNIDAIIEAASECEDAPGGATFEEAHVESQTGEPKRGEPVYELGGHWHPLLKGETHSVDRFQWNSAQKRGTYLGDNLVVCVAAE